MQSPPGSPLFAPRERTSPPRQQQKGKRSRPEYDASNPLAMPRKTKASKGLNYDNRNPVFPLSPKKSCPEGPPKKRTGFVLPKDTINPRTLFSMFNDDDDDDDDDDEDEDEDLSVDEIMRRMIFPF